MAVNKAEKKTLSSMWSKASASASSVAAGKYMFKIESAKYQEGDKGPAIKEMLKIIGGNEEFVGETISQYNNLATEQNMSFFKQKLQRLGIDIPEDFTEIEDGTVCEEMEGLTFEGEVKIKNGFVNVYINRLVDSDEEDDEPSALDDDDDEDSEGAEGTSSDDDEDESEEEEEESDDEDEEEPEDKEADEDDSDDDSEEDEEEEDDSEDDEESEEEDESEEGEEFPTPDEVAGMKAKQVNEILSAIDLDPKDIASPKKVLEGISNYLYTKKYTPEIDVFNMVVKALNVKGLKGKSPAEKNKAVKQAVENLLS